MFPMYKYIGSRPWVGPMKDITIIAPDKVGLLADISYILGKARVNIESIAVTSVGGKAVITVLVKKQPESNGCAYQKTGF